MKQISLFEPNITRLEKKMVMEALNKNQISTYGYFTNLLVKEIKKITSSKYNLATNSGSSALFLAFKSIGVKKEEIIITQSYTFTATTNAIITEKIPLENLLVVTDDLNLDFGTEKEFLKNETFKKKNYTFHKNTKKKISCVCLVLTLGIIPNLDKINYLRKKYNLKIVFDAACALGHKYKKNKLTKYCDAAVYSLNGNKNFIDGDIINIGGKSQSVYDFAKKFANNGKIMNAYNYKMIGFNLNVIGSGKGGLPIILGNQ